MNYQSEFPIFKRKIHNKRMVYLDSAATSQIPKKVVDAMTEFEFTHRANVHRGIHTLSEEATHFFDQARSRIAKFIDANVPEEIVFTRNTTEGLNAIAYSWGYKNLSSNDVILISEAEHHSNFIPWQMLAKETGCQIDFIPINSQGFLDINAVQTDWKNVKLVAYHLVSNVLGVLNDAKEINKTIKKKVGEAKKLSTQEFDLRKNFPVFVIDVSQAIAHIPVNVKKLGADFVAFSGHKMYGPMGIGVLWVARHMFGDLKPYFYGGGMIKEVKYLDSTFTSMPEMMEAGTPNVTGVIGLAAACDFIDSIGYEAIAKHDSDLMYHAIKALMNIDGLTIYGTTDPSKRCSLIAFNLEKIPSHDLATVLDAEGVAIRSGQHCVMPWHIKHKIQTSARISFGIYNQKEDIDILVKGIDRAKDLIIV